MDRQKVLNIAKLVLKLGFTTLLIWLVFQKIDFKQVKLIFLKSNPLFIIGAFLLLIASQVISSWRLKGFLYATNIPVPFLSNLRLYSLGLFYNSFLPGGIGGDAYKIFLLRARYKTPAKQILIAILLDRISGLWAITMLATIFLSLLRFDFIPDYLLPVMFITATILYYVVIYYFFRKFTHNFFPGHLKASLAQSLQVLSIVFILLSQHFTGEFFPYLLSFLVSSIATAIPVSIGGAGVREFVFLKLSGVLHFDPTLAIFTTLTFYLLSLMVSLPGVWFVVKRNEWSISSKELGK
ncbi:MAG: lysylphosphatidylglycerol synthase transmembrane domain-containing protein [Chitinophagaceae bacterium]